jgi:hypothetical protein
MRIENSNPEVESLLFASLGSRVRLRVHSPVMLTVEGVLRDTDTPQFYKLEAPVEIHFGLSDVKCVYPTQPPPGPDFDDSEHTSAAKAAALEDWEHPGHTLSIIIGPR